MKKIISLVLASLMVLSLTACGGGSSAVGHVKSFEEARPLESFASYEEKRYSDDVKYSDIDMVKFGSYPQSDATGNKKEPIFWIPVNKNEKERKIYLMSKDILDGYVYEYRNDGNGDLWRNHYKDLAVIEFLNSTFYDEAFSDDEKSMIEEMTSDNVKVNTFNIGYKGRTGAIEGFYQIMKATPTKYALRTVNINGYDRTFGVDGATKNGFAEWWYGNELPTNDNHNVTICTFDGEPTKIEISGSSYSGVRPFICVNY